MMIFQLKIINIVLCVNAYNDRRDVGKEFCIGTYNDHHTRALAPFAKHPIIQDESSNRIDAASLQATSDKDSGRTFVFDAFNSIANLVSFSSRYLAQISRFLGYFLLIRWTRVKLAWRRSSWLLIAAFRSVNLHAFLAMCRLVLTECLLLDWRSSCSYSWPLHRTN